MPVLWAGSRHAIPPGSASDRPILFGSIPTTTTAATSRSNLDQRHARLRRNDSRQFCEGGW
jgi:hypothetical protein